LKLYLASGTVPEGEAIIGIYDTPELAKERLIIFLRRDSIDIYDGGYIALFNLNKDEPRGKLIERVEKRSI